MSKIKIGILGCGAVAYRWYLHGLSGPNKQYELFAVCDQNIQLARDTAKNFNVPHFCSSKEELFNLGIDLAVVLTRHSNHYEHNKYFLSKKVHVYSEKPFAEKVNQGKELVKLAQKHSLIFGTAPQIMLSSRNKTLKKLLDKKIIGKTVLIRSSCSNLGPAGRSDTNYDPRWFYKDGGCLPSLGIYSLSLLIWLMGKPLKICSFNSTALRKRIVAYGPFKGKKFNSTAPDNVVSIFNFGKGCLALFDSSYVVTNPPKYELEIQGSQGTLLVNGFGGSESITFKDIHGRSKHVGPKDNSHQNWNLAWGVENTVSAIKNNSKLLVDAPFALKVLEVIEQMNKSAKINNM